MRKCAPAWCICPIQWRGYRMTALSITPAIRRSSWSMMSTARTWTSSVPPIASCFWQPAAARLACSPLSRGSGPSTGGCCSLSPSRGLTLFAQHVDPIDTGTLVDMFRARRRCLSSGNGCGARRCRRSGPVAAAHRARPRAVGAADHSGKGTPARIRRQCLSGHDREAQIAAGIRQAHPQGERPRACSSSSTRGSPHASPAPFRQGMAIQRMGLVEAIETSRAFPALHRGRSAFSQGLQQGRTSAWRRSSTIIRRSSTSW